MQRFGGSLQEEIERVHGLPQIVRGGGKEIRLFAAGGFRGQHLLLLEREQCIRLGVLIFLRRQQVQVLFFQLNVCGEELVIEHTECTLCREALTRYPLRMHAHAVTDHDHIEEIEQAHVEVFRRENPDGELQQDDR